MAAWQHQDISHTHIFFKVLFLFFFQNKIGHTLQYSPHKEHSQQSSTKVCWGLSGNIQTTALVSPSSNQAEVKVSSFQCTHSYYQSCSMPFWSVKEIELRCFASSLQRLWENSFNANRIDGWLLYATIQMFLALWKGLSKQGTLQLTFELWHSGEILQTCRQQIPDTLSDEAERALSNRV